MLMTEIGKLLLILGIILSIMGLIFIFGSKVPGLGRLTGRYFHQKGEYYFLLPYRHLYPDQHYRDADPLSVPQVIF